MQPCCAHWAEASLGASLAQGSKGLVCPHSSSYYGSALKVQACDLPLLTPMPLCICPKFIGAMGMLLAILRPSCTIPISMERPMSMACFKPWGGAGTKQVQQQQWAEAGQGEGRVWGGGELKRAGDRAVKGADWWAGWLWY